MIERYVVVAGRIRQELTDLERVVDRAERAIMAARRPSEEADLYLDAAALNLHDFYAGLERMFHHIASTVDRTVPTGHDWHRELLRQMGVALPIRPRVLSAGTVKAIDEYLRFRHVVRNIYTFDLDAAQLDRLVQNLRPSFEQVQADLLAFASFLDGLAHDES